MDTNGAAVMTGGKPESRAFQQNADDHSENCQLIGIAIVVMVASHNERIQLAARPRQRLCG